MTSYEISIGFWAIGYTFHPFYGSFRYLSSREIQSTIPEDRMTHFVTLTVPPRRTDNSLSQHRQGRSPGQTVSDFMTLQKTSVSGHFRDL
jgi:hypothetical protein